MILPSDSDLPPDRNDGSNPDGDSDPGANWWGDSSGEADDAGENEDEDEDEDGDPSYFGDPDELDEPPVLASVAGPGWRKDLYKDLLDSLRDLEAIEDPDDEFAPPEPPDLYTFFGELAALRTELRHQGQRSNEGLNELGKSLAPLLRSAVSGKSGKAGHHSPAAGAGVGAAAEAGPGTCSASGPWSAETCLALISVWDLLPQATSAAAYEASLQPLLAAAGLTRIPTIGEPFDPATMTLGGTQKAPRKAVGIVLRETAAGFLHAGVLLRPAAVIIGSAA